MPYLICHMRTDANGGDTYVPLIVYDTKDAVQWWLDGQAEQWDVWRIVDRDPTVVKWDSEFRASIYASEDEITPMETFAILPFTNGEPIVL